MKFRGGCCDMPSPEMMNAEVVNDTLYIDKAVEYHTSHDKVGICGITVKVIINTKKYPAYKKLVISYKELNTTKRLRKSHFEKD